MKKHNDDLVMAYAIGCWVKDTAYSVNQRDIEYQKAFLTSLTSTDRILNTAIPGMLGYDEKVKKENDTNQARENYREFSWLLKG